MRPTRRLLALGEADDLLDLLRRDPRFAAAPAAHLAELGPAPRQRTCPGHAPAVTGVTPTVAAILELATPSAAINNTFARFTSRCAAVEDRASNVNDWR